MKLNELQTGYTKMIDISDKEYIECTSSNAQKINIPEDEMEYYSNWIKIKSKHYYVKHDITSIRLLRELIGVELSKYMGLKTIEYNLCGIDGELIGLISENFRKKEDTYISGCYIGQDRKNYFKRLFFDNDFKSNTREKELFTAYILRNFFAAQKDRHCNSLITSNNELAPLYDYEFSLEEPNFYMYIDPIMNIAIDSEANIEYLIEHNEYFEYYMEKVLEFDFSKTMTKIEESTGLVLPTKDKDEVLDFEEDRKQFLRTIGFKH